MSVGVDVPFVDLDGDGDVRRGRNGFDVNDSRFLYSIAEPRAIACDRPASAAPAASAMFTEIDVAVRLS